MQKATAVALRLIDLEGEGIHILKLIKLMYLVDRASFEARNIPVIGGWYVSMKHGPVTSEILDAVNGADVKVWSEHISDRENHTVSKISNMAKNPLSESEEKLIREVYQLHREKDQFSLRDWCHANCPEWHEIETGMQPISPERFFEALGKSDAQRDRILQELSELEKLRSLLG